MLTLLNFSTAIEQNLFFFTSRQVIATFVMLYQYLGIYCLIGAVVAMAVSPLTVGMTVLEAKLQGKHMKKKDQRVEMVTEVINNIKVVVVQTFAAVRKREFNFHPLFDFHPRKHLKPKAASERQASAHTEFYLMWWHCQL